MRGEDGLLPAMHALYRGDLEEARGLLPADSKLTAPEAAAFGRLERLSELLDEDPARVNELSPDGFAPLHLAIFGGQEAAVRLLIDRGADLEAVSTASFAQVRPLGTATFVGSVPLARILLEAGADPNGASAHGDEQMAALLRGFGARD